eukprot:CAMPEP_0174888370 /NCGR_PEP_ID=MMETSP0167-20121228/3654_1 /TAXON_ID=38298 /ORGANISM="Rhodella maculata, Strain CCMP736" /LENGTH=35 /DNA_ID= /DNA_START= /DNA_END= /DNA_ORIENTATION=
MAAPTAWAPAPAPPGDDCVLLMAAAATASRASSGR